MTSYKTTSVVYFDDFGLREAVLLYTKCCDSIFLNTNFIIIVTVDRFVVFLPLSDIIIDLATRLVSPTSFIKSLLRSYKMFHV